MTALSTVAYNNDMINYTIFRNLKNKKSKACFQRCVTLIYEIVSFYISFFLKTNKSPTDSNLVIKHSFVFGFEYINIIE